MSDAAREVENLLYRYAERIDAGDFAGVAELFAEGRILAAPDAPPEATFAGRERVLALYRGSVRLHADGTPRTKHVTTNAIVEVDAEAGTATARSNYTVFQQVDDGPLQAIVCGRYHDTFRCQEGEWRFDSRTMFVDLTGDLGQHLKIELG